MKAVIQPLAWGVAVASILALATSFALAVTSGTVLAVAHSQAEQVSSSAPESALQGYAEALDEPLRR